MKRLSAIFFLIVGVAGYAGTTAVADESFVIPVSIRAAKVFESQAGKPGVVAANAVAYEATVAAINYADRQVTLVNASGTTSTLTVDNQVRDLDQVKKGDKVKTTYTAEVALFVRESYEPPDATEKSTVTLAPKGAKPGIEVVKTTEITGNVDAIDYDKRTVTLSGPLGNGQTFGVDDSVKRFDEVRRGDQVVIRYSEALAITVSKP